MRSRTLKPCRALMDNDLDIFQINLHKAYAPTAELNNLLKTKTSFIALIQEPVARVGSIKGLNKKMGNVGGNRNIRAAIYTSRNINIHPLYHLSTMDQAVAMMTIKKGGKDINIIICSSYFPYEPPNGPPTPEFATIVDYCKESNFPLLSCIDTTLLGVALTSILEEIIY